MLGSGKRVIRLGDSTSHGGKVVSAASHFTMFDKAVALEGDACTCPIKGHTHCVIVGGDPNWTIDGRGVALEGFNKASCGADLISSLSAVNRGFEGGGTATLGLAAADQSPTSRFDEQIRFLNAKNAPLARIDYTLYLADGSSHSGVTDDQGKTQRVLTSAPQSFSHAVLQPRKLDTCCAIHAQQTADAANPLVIKVADVATNAVDVGSSTKAVKTPEGQARGLTGGEIEMARLVFKDSIDYTKVKVHNGEYLWFGLQPDDTAMTPDGEMYFNPKYFKEDYAKLDADMQQWFVHELAHIWQHQMGYPVKLRGAVRVGLTYEYTLAKGRRLSAYNMEAQADVLADYYVLKFLGDPTAMRQQRYAGALEQYERETLVDFLANPANRKNLPGGD